MKKLISTMLLTILCLFFSASAGENFNWKGCEYSIDLSGSIPVNNKISFRGDLTYFKTPLASVDQTFIYLGFDYALYSDSVHSFAVGPRLGTVSGWFEGDGFLTSIWTNYNSSKTYNVFVEFDVYHYAGNRDYYGLYLADYSLPVGNNTFLFGLGMENVNENVWLGPRTGARFGEHFILEGRYWYFLPEEIKGHSFRTVAILIF